MRGLWLLAGWLAACGASRAQFEIEGRYWITAAVTRVRIDVVDTEIDLPKDLGIRDRNFPEVRASAGRGRHRVRFAFTPIRYEGDQEVARTLVFAGRSYTVGTRVISDVEVRHFKLGWSWQFLAAAGGVVRVGPLVEAHGFLLETRLSAPNLRPPQEQRERFGVGTPAVGAALEVRPHARVNLFAEPAGMSLGRYGNFFGGDFGVRLYPAEHVGVTGGYRILRLNATPDPDFARVRIHGPFVGASLRF